MNLSPIDYYRNPELRLTLEAAARRERARKVGRLLGNALVYLFTKEYRHAAGSHFARQG
jgi:hypothetical protein